MRLFCRFFALFLAGTLFFNTTALAATKKDDNTYRDQKKITQTAAVDVMNMLGLMRGYSDGKFEPQKPVTRAEMSKIIYVLCTGLEDASNYQSTSIPFQDLTDCWAINHIKYCYNQGLLNGKNSWAFAPNDSITATETAKMLLVLAGYTSSRCGFSGSNWETNVLRYAGESGLLEGIDTSLTAPLPRQYAARLLSNAIDMNYVKWSSDRNDFKTTGETLGNRRMKLITTEGVLLSALGASIDNGSANLVEARILNDSTRQSITITDMTRNYVHLLGQHVKCYSRKSGINYGMVSDDYNVVNEELKGSKIKSIDGENRITVDKTNYSVNTTNGILICNLDATKNDDGEYQMQVSSITIKSSPLELAAAIKGGSSATAHVISNDGDYLIDVIVYYTKNFVKQYFIDD